MRFKRVSMLVLSLRVSDSVRSIPRVLTRLRANELRSLLAPHDHRLLSRQGGRITIVEDILRLDVCQTHAASTAKLESQFHHTLAWE